MLRVGRYVTHPGTGAHCEVTIDSGEKIIVHHDWAGTSGGLLTIEVSKFMGFRSDRIFACNLDSPQGQAILAWLIRGAEPGSLAASPLGAAAAFVKDSGTLAELRTRCAVLMSSR